MDEHDTDEFEILKQILDPKHTALLVIDVQNDDSSPKGIIASKGGDISVTRKTVSHIKLVLKEARRLGLLVIFTKTTFSKNQNKEMNSIVRRRDFHPHARILREHGYKIEGTWGHEILDELHPKPSERQITKYRMSAFMGTPLDLILKAESIKTAVVAGQVTEACVESTVRDLHQYGYYPIVLSDCVSSSRQDRHKASLLVMSPMLCDLLSSEELLKVWHSLPKKKR